MQQMGDCAHVPDASIDLVQYLFDAGLKFGRDSIRDGGDIHYDGTEILTHTVVKLAGDSLALLVLHLDDTLAEEAEHAFRSGSFFHLALQFSIGFTELRGTFPNPLLQGVVRFA